MAGGGDAGATGEGLSEATDEDTFTGQPGETYVLPPTARAGEGDTKSERPHLLIVPASKFRPGTAVYGTTTPQAPEWACPHARVIGSGRRGNGLPADTTRFLGVNLTYVLPDELYEYRGQLIDADLDRVKRAVKKGLGIGQQHWDAPSAQAGSWRGRVVEVPRPFGRRQGFAFAAVLTDHAHSAAGRYQVLVPMLSSHPDEDDPEQDVPVSDPALVSLLGTDVEQAVWAVPRIVSIFVGPPPPKPRGVPGPAPVRQVLTLVTSPATSRLPDKDLAAIEAVLIQRFGLRNVR